MKHWLIILISGAFNLNCWAWQIHPSNGLGLPDTSSGYINQLGSQIQKIDYQLYLAEKLQYADQKSATKHAGDALAAAILINDPTRTAFAKYWLAWLDYQWNLKPDENILSTVTQIIDALGDRNDPLLKARLFSLKAALISTTDSTNAVLNLNSGLGLVPLITHQPVDSAWVLAYLISVKAIVQKDVRLQMQSLHLFEAAGDSVRVGKTCLNICGPIYEPDKFNIALRYIQRANNAFKAVSYTTGENNAFKKYLDMLLTHYSLTFDESVWDTIDQKVHRELSVRSDDPDLLCKTALAYAQKAHIQQDNIPLSNASLKTAMQYFRQALPLAVREHNSSLVDLLAKNMSKYCTNFDNCDTISRLISDAYYEMVVYKNKQATVAQDALDQYHRDKQLHFLKTEEAKRKWLWRFFGIFVLGAAIAFVIYHQRRRIRTLNRELKNRMDALRAQMNPHFISNALNAIDSLVNHGRNKEASHYIIQFSRLCRIILNNSRSETISLGEEMDMLTYFLNLEKLRLGEKLNYQIDVDPTLNKDNIQIPPMLVQPFVENAIWHGITPLPEQAKGMVTVKAEKMDDQFFRCIIEDNGVGREKSKELKKQMVVAQPSHGLSITEERLEAITKLQGSDIFMEDLYHADNSAAGTRVTIKLPLTI